MTTTDRHATDIVISTSIDFSTDLDEIIKDEINKGVVFVGASAGAVLAGPDISPIGTIDDPKVVPNLKSTKSLNLVDFVIIPHFDDKEDKEENLKIMQNFKDKFKLIPLNNNQAVIVEGDSYKIVEST